MVEHLSDDDLRHLRRGGHDYRKLYSAYKLALEQRGAPTVILAHTVKGWTLGSGFEGRNSTHQIKKIGEAELRAFRDLLHLPISDKLLADAKPPYYHPGKDSDESSICCRAVARWVECCHAVSCAPSRSSCPARSSTRSSSAAATRAASTTMVFAGILRNLLRDPKVGHRIVPIIPDEARTFGMDALFSEMKIYAPFGQLYEPVDAGHGAVVSRSDDGQILEEGITEAGSMGTFTAAGTAYATHGQAVIPFYIYYSMFGYQRVGDLVWAFGDSRGRGFMLGGTAGRTTLNGEGLQHEDGHSPLLFSALPNVRIYDPAFAYELATVIQRRHAPDVRRRRGRLLLHHAVQRELPDARDASGKRGRASCAASTCTVRPSRSAHITRASSRAAAPCRPRSKPRRCSSSSIDVAAEVWSATSFQLLRQDALEVERWNRLHPDAEPRVSYVERAARRATAGPSSP